MTAPRPSALLLALLLVNLPWAGLARADAVAGDAESGARNVADPGTVLTIGNPVFVLHHNASTAFASVAYPENASLVYNSTVDLTITALGAALVNPAADATYRLVAPSGAPMGGAASARDDLEHCGWSAAKVAAYNATTTSAAERSALAAYMAPCAPAAFANLTFVHAVLDEAGAWTVVNATSGATVSSFRVSPRVGETVVTLGRTSAPYAPAVSGGFFFTIDAADPFGAPRAGATVTISPPIAGFANGATTDGTGRAVALQSGTPPAGAYLVRVSSNVTGSSDADAVGEATLTIDPAPLSTAWNDSTARTGSPAAVSFTPLLPPDASNAVAAVFASGSSFLASPVHAFNLSVTYPDGSMVWAASTATAGDLSFAGALSGCYNATSQLWYGARSGGNACPMNVSSRLVGELSVGIGSSARVSFAPGSDLWVGGTYTFGLTLDTVSATFDDAANEYAGAASFAPTGAASINLALAEGGQPANAIAVLPAASNALQLQTLQLNITGANVFSHPLCETNTDPGQALARSHCRAASKGGAAPNAMDEANYVSQNVAIGGAVLTGTSWGLVGVPAGNTLGAYNYMTYDATTGIVTISNVVPTGSGDVVFTATWPGVGATSLTVPTTGGMALSLSTPSVPADEATPFTASVSDAFGNVVATAQITCLYEDGATSPSNLAGSSCVGPGIQGTGAPGLGQGGSYDVNVTSSVMSSLILQATLQPSGGGQPAYALARLDVTADHDYTVTTNVADTSAGLPTFLSVRAVDGAGAGVPASTGQLYLLTAQERDYLFENGTRALGIVQSGGLTSRHYGSGGTALLGNSSGGWLNATVTLGAGTYYVFVQDAAGGASTHDDLDGMPTLTVHNYTVDFQPASIPVWWIGKSNVTVNVTVRDWNGDPAPNGTFIEDSVTNSTGALVNPSTHAVSFDDINATALTVNGKMALTLTAGIPGTLRVEVKPPSRIGTSLFTGATGALVLQGPGVTVFPSSFTQGRTTPLTVTVTDVAGAPLAGVEVRACGQSLNPNFPATFPATLDASQQASCAALSTTNAQGSVTLTLSPTLASPIEVYVNLADAGVSVPVLGGALALSIDDASPTAGDAVTLTVTTTDGTPVPGATLTIAHDGEAVASPSLDDAGRAMLSDLAQGNYSTRATFSTFTPAYLNFTVAPPPFVDTAPTLAITSPASGSIVRGLATIAGNVSDPDDQPVAVRVRVDGGAWQQAHVASGWTFLLDTTALDDGLHEVEAQATDGALGSTIDAIQLVVRNAPPSVSIASPSEGASVQGRLLVGGDASQPEGSVVLVEISLDAGAWRAANGTGPWSASLDVSALQNGEHTLTARATDDAGNRATTQRAIRVANAPSVTILTPDSSRVEGGVVVVSGQARGSGSGPLAVELRVDDGAWQPAWGNASWARYVDTAALADGMHDLSARATQDGLVSGVALVQIRTANGAPPALRVDAPGNGSTVGGLVAVSGRAFAPQGHVARVEWSAGGAMQTAFGLENWSFTWDARPVGAWGQATLFVRATDDAGRQTGALLALQVDNRADAAIAPADIKVERAPFQTDFGNVPNGATERRLVHVVVHDLGASATGAGSVTLTATTSSGTRLVGNVTLPAIAPGGSAEVVIAWDTTGTVGDVTLTARAFVPDAQRDVANDAASVQQRVLAGGLGFGFTI